MNNFDLSTILRQSARAQSALSLLKGETKNRALRAAAELLQEQSDTVLEANTIDLEQARGQQQSKWMLDGMKLTPERLKYAAKQLIALSRLPDPVGAVDRTWNYDTGVSLVRRRIPLGVLGLAYEVYPEIQVGGIGMALKSGNAIVVAGSASVAATQAAIVDLFSTAAYAAGIPEGTIQSVPSTAPEGLQVLLHQDRFIDLMLLCGRGSWVERMQEQSTVPTIAAQFGRGHVYIAASASWKQVQSTLLANDYHQVNLGDLQRRFQIPVMGIVMHEAWAEQHLDALIVQLREREVVVDPDERVAAILPNLANRDGAKGGVPLRIVSTLDEAIGWLCKHSYGQLEGIVTNSLSDIDSFSRSLTASSVYVNCLPHLGDPRNSQLGAFLGISTSKLHARGPIGLENLTTVKYIATGSSLPSA
ncbi:MAG: aldehyde dehydrogenase family protein [Cyanobacteria bacterium P01_G01_bin.4]